MRRSVVRRFAGRYFDESVKQLQRAAVARRFDRERTQEHDFLRVEVGQHLLDRLDDIREGAFPRVLYRSLGSSSVWARLLRSRRADVREVVAEGAECNLATSLLSLHWVDDLDAELARVRASLVPDAPFLGAMWTTGTLGELRSCLCLADMERSGGVVPRMSPLCGPDDLARALGAAGFVGVLIDQQDMVPTYSSVQTLLDELWLMGERGALATPGRASRDALMAAIALYPHLYGEQGRLPATFQALYWIAWTPGPLSPVAKKRGSAVRSFKELETGPGGGGGKKY